LRYFDEWFFSGATLFTKDAEICSARAQHRLTPNLALIGERGLVWEPLKFRNIVKYPVRHVGQDGAPITVKFGTKELTLNGVRQISHRSVMDRMGILR